MKTDPFNLWYAKQKLQEHEKAELIPAIAALEYLSRKFRVTQPKGDWDDDVFELLEPKVAPYHALKARMENSGFIIGHSLRHCANLFAADPFEVRRLVRQFSADDFTAIINHLPSDLVAELLTDDF